jgi:hypothetical protein
MEGFAEQSGIQEQEMRAEGEAEGAVRKGQRRQLRVHVTARSRAGLEVGEEALHRRQADLPQLLDAANVSIPDELVRVQARLFQHFIVGRREARFELGAREAINRIAQDHMVPSLRRFGIEAGRTIAAAEDAPLEIGGRQREHAAVFVERSAPRDHFVQREHARRILC